MVWLWKVVKIWLYIDDAFMITGLGLEFDVGCFHDTTACVCFVLKMIVLVFLIIKRSPMNFKPEDLFSCSRLRDLRYVSSDGGLLLLWTRLVTCKATSVTSDVNADPLSRNQVPPSLSPLFSVFYTYPSTLLLVLYFSD